jgi:[acyl-carrier-protein] S-malonyltransferase
MAPALRNLIASLQTAPLDPTLALVFPGQGSQHVGMAKEAAREFPAARDIFAVANEVLEMDLASLCFDGPEEELTATANAQPAILTASLALLACAVHCGRLSRRPAFTAGHSLGEYTALVAAGSLSVEDALLLVRERGRLMAEAGRANPGALAAILALPEEAVHAICEESGAEPANYNGATQIVVGGPPATVARAMELARARGGKALPVKVSGAFHTSLMKPAAEQFAGALDGIQIGDPAIPVISNMTALPMTAAAEVRRDLRLQLMRPVRWEHSVRFLAASGISTAIEVGPGRVLTAMIKRIAPDMSTANIESAAALTSPSNV